MRQLQREFGAFIPECAKRGIGKTKAYELDRAGLIETFTIGSKRYIYIDSLLTLPQRLKDAGGRCVDPSAPSTDCPACPILA